jgi:FolB domain-containing protein
MVKVGVTSEERAFPQLLTLELSIVVESDAAEINDNLKDTLDYIAVIDGIKERVSADQWNLIEKFGADICSLVLKLSPLVQHVSISVGKQVHPETEGVSVTIERARPE